MQRWRALGLAALAGTAISPVARRAAPAYPLMHPASVEYEQISASATPPTEAQCFSVGRRCFTPQSTRSAYNVQPLYNRGLDGRGITASLLLTPQIAMSSTIA